jgi:hypothetical protein
LTNAGEREREKIEITSADGKKENDGNIFVLLNVFKMLATRDVCLF